MGCSDWLVEGWYEAVEDYLQHASPEARLELTRLRRRLRQDGASIKGAHAYPALGKESSVLLTPHAGLHFQVTEDCHVVIVGLRPF